MRADTTSVLTSSAVLFEGLVSSRRFGAALSAARAVDGASLVAMSRRCDQWWRPDELAGFEQGRTPLEDSSVIALTRLYRLSGCPLPDHEAFELLVDRSTSTEVATSGEDPSLSSDQLQPAAIVVIRAVAVARLCGAPLTPMDLVVLGDVVGHTPAELKAVLRDVESNGVIDSAVGGLASHIVVPLTGVLIAETSAGSLLAVRPAGRRGRPSHGVAAAASLRSALAVVAA